MDGAPGPHGLTRLLLRLEAAFWLVRPATVFTKVPIAVPAWTIGLGAAGASVRELAFLVVFLMLIRPLMAVANDITDARRDAVSAPYLPIPSGLLPLRAAMVEFALIVATIVLALRMVTPDVVTILAVLATLGLAGVIHTVYAMRKSWTIAPLLASVGSSFPAFSAWLLAGHRNAAAFVLLFAVVTVHGVQMNVMNHLRDIAGDPLAGVRTIAVRLGARRTYWLAVALLVLELAGAATLALGPGTALGLVWLLPPVALLALTLRRRETLYAADRDRVGQTRALSQWIYASFFTEIAILGAFHPRAAVLVALGMIAWFNLCNLGYRRRIVEGRLRARLTEAGRVSSLAPA